MNEIDFGLVRHYCSLGILSNISRLHECGFFYRTESESECHLLEPWIQWVTVHTGLDYSENGASRLGDIVARDDLVQAWEELELQGKRIGAISPCNTANRLKKSALLMRIEKAGVKAMLLDQLLSDVFIKLCLKHKLGFASLFLHSGAHRQHHYLFNSASYSGSNTNPEWSCVLQSEPLEGILAIHDKMIGDIVKTENRVIIATGLHQVPHEVTTFYWRLKNHSSFSEAIGINNSKTNIPRISRDFLIELHTVDHATAAADVLLNTQFSVKDSPVFSVDNRGSSPSIELVYANKVTEDDSVTVKGGKFMVGNIQEHLSLVATKNGEHDGEEYVLSNFNVDMEKAFPLRDMKDVIIRSVA